MMVQDSVGDLSLTECENDMIPSDKDLQNLILTSEISDEFIPEDGVQKRRTRITFILYLVVAFLFGIVITYALNMMINHGQTVGMTLDNASMTNMTDTNEPTIMVDIHGDVAHEGVYHLPVDSRVIDAVKAAGGYLHKEDSKFVNQAEPLVDGQEIIVSPYRSTRETTQPILQNQEQGNHGLQNPTNAKIDLNTAEVSTLETIPGIGPKRAGDIIEYRNAHGPFSTVTDLEKIRGFGKLTLSKIQPYVYVETGHSFS